MFISVVKVILFNLFFLFFHLYKVIGLYIFCIFICYFFVHFTHTLTKRNAVIKDNEVTVCVIFEGNDNSSSISRWAIYRGECLGTQCVYPLGESYFRIFFSNIKMRFLTDYFVNKWNNDPILFKCIRWVKRHTQNTFVWNTKVLFSKLFVNKKYIFSEKRLSMNKIAFY